LERAEKNRIAFQERQELIKVLAERNNFELPQSMVERTIDSMMRGALRTVAQQGVDPRKLNLDFDRFREELRPRAVSELRGTLLLEAIAQRENIAPTDEEIEKRISQIAEDEKIALHQVKKRFRTPEDRQQLFLRVQEEKTLEFLKSHARYS
jgi:trigger factor